MSSEDHKRKNFYTNEHNRLLTGVEQGKGKAEPGFRGGQRGEQGGLGHPMTLLQGQDSGGAAAPCHPSEAEERPEARQEAGRGLQG